MNPTTIRCHIWMVVFSLIIAGSYPASALITQHVDSVILTFWRFLCATIIFLLMLPFVKGVTRPGWKDLGRYTVVGGSYGMFFILMFESLKFTTPLNASTIYTMLPLLTMVLSRLFGHPYHLRRLAILALSMAATLWVIFRGDVQQFLELEYSRGDVLFFLGTCCAAVYMFSMKVLQRDESKVYFTFFSLFIATFALFCAAAIRAHGLSIAVPHDTRVWLGLAYLAGPSTAGTFWILQYTAPRLGPNRVVAYTFLTPSIVAAMEWGFGISLPQWSVLPGIGITLAAVFLLQTNFASGKNKEAP